MTYREKKHKEAYDAEYLRHSKPAAVADLAHKPEVIKPLSIKCSD